MIKIIEKEFLNDNFIIKPFAGNININDKIYFSKNDTYYFGNYEENKVDLIKNKIRKNKKRILNAIEDGVKFVIHGNSIEIFNNSFKKENINLFTAYDKKRIIKKNKLKIINSLKTGIDTFNFRYKNLTCFK